MKTTHFMCLLTACCICSFVSNLCRAEQTDDEAEIRKSDEAYTDAYNKHDAKALAALWSPEAVYVDPETGDQAVGREAIEKEFTETFEGLKDAKLEVDVKSIKFLSPNVAVETGIAKVIHPKEDPDESTYSALFVKHEGKWLLDRVTEEESAAPLPPPPSNYEHLKDLEWMVGSWIDNDEDDHAMIQTDCDWTKNKNFMHRSFAVVIGDQVNMAGMQIIGWDPVAKQIHSWVFDSDGGFSEGKWKHKGDRWLIEQTGMLPDGSKTSAVNIMKQIDNDSFTWKTVQRTVNGDMLPVVDEVTVVRNPAGKQTASSP